MAPNPTKTFAGIYEAYLVEPSRKITKAWYDAWTQLVSNSNSSLVSGVNGSIQYNDNGVQAGDGNLLWDKTKQQQHIVGIAGQKSPVLASTASGNIGVTPGTAASSDIYLGGQTDASGNTIPDSTVVADIFVNDDPSFFSGSRCAGIDFGYGLTPGAPDPFTNGVGHRIVAPTDTSGQEINAFHVYQYGGLGTGAKPGMTVFADRNDSGAGAASTLGLEQLDGTEKFIWFDATGAPRYGPARPTENSSVSDTSGTLFGSGGTSTTNITQLFTRRGEEGRSGIPGLPGPAGATGSTGATGPTGADGIIISRRADEGRAGIPGINGAAGVAGATGPAGQSAPVISRRGDDGRMGNPGPTGPTGATAATTRAITFAIDGGGSVLTTGVKAEQTIPYGCTITANTVLADQSGSVALDIKKTTFAGFPGSLASIVASAPPTLSSAQKSTDSTLTGWGTTINAGDVLQWTVSSVTTVTRVNCTLTVTA